MNSPLKCSQLGKHYVQGNLKEAVLQTVSFEMGAGQTCALLGPSGSGKTTLLSILGCLLTPSAGELFICGQNVDFTSAAVLAQMRRTKLGFVFQHAQLLPFLTVEENLRVVGSNAGLGPSLLTQRIHDVLNSLGMLSYLDKKPAILSGGQRQRIAIARAVLHQPSIILADEPTASLDWQNGELVTRMLVDQARTTGAALVVVTHDARLLPWFDRVLEIQNGKVSELAANHYP